MLMHKDRKSEQRRIKKQAVAMRKRTSKEIKGPPHGHLINPKTKKKRNLQKRSNCPHSVLVTGRARLVAHPAVNIRIADILFELLPPLLIHLLVGVVREHEESANDQAATDDGGKAERRVQRRGEELVDQGDDENSQERGDGRQNGRCQTDQDKERARESCSNSESALDQKKKKHA